MGRTTTAVAEGRQRPGTVAAGHDDDDEHDDDEDEDGDDDDSDRP